METKDNIEFIISNKDSVMFHIAKENKVFYIYFPDSLMLKGLGHKKSFMKKIIKKYNKFEFDDISFFSRYIFIKSLAEGYK